MRRPRGSATRQWASLPRSDAAGALAVNFGAPASTETQSSAPIPNSRLLSAEGHVCPHTTYVRELASQTTKPWDGRPAPGGPSQPSGPAPPWRRGRWALAEHPSAALDHCQPLSGDWQAARSSGITHSGNKGRGRLAAEGDRAEGLPPKARTRRSSSGRSTPRGHGGRCQQGHRAQLARREVELGLPGLLRRFSPSSESTAGPDPPLVAPSRLAGMDPTQGSWSPTARRETSWGKAAWQPEECVAWSGGGQRGGR